MPKPFNRPNGLREGWAVFASKTATLSLGEGGPSEDRVRLTSRVKEPGDKDAALDELVIFFDGELGL